MATSTLAVLFRPKRAPATQRARQPALRVDVTLSWRFGSLSCGRNGPMEGPPGWCLAGARRGFPKNPLSCIAVGRRRCVHGELRMREGVAARALEFTILIAARTGEVVGARWSEMDLETDTWSSRWHG